MKALQLFNDGKLSDAVDAASAALRASPMDIENRFILAQLLCFQDEFERADRQLEVFAAQATQPVPGIALCRQLIRAAKARQEFFLHGRMPEFFSAPELHIEELLRAWVFERDGEADQAVSALGKSQELRPAIAGTCNGKEFSEFLDQDNFLAPVLEVLTPTGKYFWVPLNKLRGVDFKAPGRPLDILWRPASLDVVNGPSGDAYIPSIYCRPGESNSDGIRIGRETTWVETYRGIYRGQGQKCFFADDADIAVLDIESLRFNA